MLEALESSGYDAEKTEAIAMEIALTNTVTLAELSSLGLAGRDIVALRRALRPPVRGSSVCDRRAGGRRCP